MQKSLGAYAAAGVDIDVMADGLRRVKRQVRGTFTDGVLGDVGAFGGLFASPGRGDVLVASTDGVGTKLKVAALAGVHDTVGRDLVNHCVNDILVQGARPLFFLDYLGAARLDPAVFSEVVSGLCRACRRNGCALLGGETAEMPGLYPAGEYDLVGTIVGAVPKRRLVTGERARAGDVLIGLPANGLHTNGYSLARKAILETAGLGVGDRFPGSTRTVGAVLLDVHRSYLHPVMAVMDAMQVTSMAHITGGGLVDNVPRMLPPGLAAVIDRGAWRVPRLFRFIAETGAVDREEMFRVFNMGIGFVLSVARKDAVRALEVLRGARCRGRVVGELAQGRRRVVFRG